MKDNVTKIMWHRVERQITDEDRYYYALQIQQMDRMSREEAKMGQIINLRGKNDRSDNSDNL